MDDLTDDPKEKNIPILNREKQHHTGGLGSNTGFFKSICIRGSP